GATYWFDIFLSRFSQTPVNGEARPLALTVILCDRMKEGLPRPMDLTGIYRAESLPADIDEIAERRTVPLIKQRASSARMRPILKGLLPCSMSLQVCPSGVPKPLRWLWFCSWPAA